jgi:RNA polymerase sigma-B factor
LSWLREAMLSDVPPRWTAIDDTDHRLTVAPATGTGEIRARVSGEVDRDNAEYLREQLLSVLSTGGRAPRFVVDLAGVPLLDAAGVAVLIAVREAARVRGVAVRVVGLQPYVARVVAISGLRDVLLPS